MKILVTGGAGFIGSHVVDSYLAAGHTVAVLDDLSSGKLSNLPKDIKLFKGSITDKEFVEETLFEFQPDVVNHHAAQISVTCSVSEALNDADRNILGTITILEAIRKFPTSIRLIYATSGGAMYGNGSGTAIPFNEETPVNPVSPYGLSKSVAEKYVWLYRSLHAIKAVVLRYSNVYGPRQDPHGEAGVCAIFSQKMIENNPVQIFGDGTQVRDYVFVEDVARASLLALHAGDNDYFNICTGEGVSTLKVYETLKQETQYSQDAIMAPERVGEVQVVVLSPEKAKQKLNWQAQNSFEEGIKKTVAWYHSK